MVFLIVAKQLQALFRQAQARLQLRTEIPPQVGPASEEWPADGVPVTGFPGRFLPYAAKAQSLMPDLQFMQPAVSSMDFLFSWQVEFA